MAEDFFDEDLIGHGDIEHTDTDEIPELTASEDPEGIDDDEDEDMEPQGPGTPTFVEEDDGKIEEPASKRIRNGLC